MANQNFSSLGLIALFASICSGQTTTPGRPLTSDFGAIPQPSSRPIAASGVRTGSFSLAFNVRAPLSSLETVSKRLGWSIPAMQKTGQKLEYNLSEAVFQFYVPPDYDGATGYGLLVWINSGDGGSVPEKSWLEVFNRRKMIYVGPDQVGNNRYWPVRVGKGLDAVANAKALYHIDDNRVYVAGYSGGGRAASMLGVGFPDVFTGGIYIVGCDFYRDVPLEEPNRFWLRNFFPPPRAIFTLAKTNSRHVLFTGPGDPNREQTECNYKAFL